GEGKAWKEEIMSRDERPTSADLARATGAAAATEARAPLRDDRNAPTPGPANTPLFAQNDADGLRTQWNEIQTGFVDQPRSAVERADTLVADVMKRLAESFARERDTLDRQWDHGDNVTTEDLRLALQRYRSFFDRLLSIRS